MRPKFNKTPGSLLDYGVDWIDWLGSDTIVDNLWTAEPGIVIDHDSFTPTSSIVWLDGGTNGESYVVNSHITTAAGREEDQPILIKVQAK